MPAASRHVTRAKEVVLIITTFGLPLVFFGPHPEEPFNVTKLSLLFAGLSGAIALHVVQVAYGHRTRGSYLILIPAATIILPLALSWAASPYRGWAAFGTYSRFTGLLPYLAFAILGILLVDAFWGRETILIRGMAIAGALVGTYALAQAVGLDPLWKPGTNSGTPFPPSSVGHFNFAGGFLAICLPFAVHLWITSERSLLAMGTTIAITMGLLMTNSQGAWVAGLAGVVIVVGAASSSRWPRVWLGARISALLLAFMVILGVAVSASSERPPLGATAKSRGLLWGSALEMGAASPVLGRGPSSYAVEGDRYRPLSYVLIEKNTRADDPHSVPLAFWANAGALGALGFLLLTVWILRKGRLSAADPLAAVFFAGCVAYLVQSLVTIDELTLRAGFWVSLAGLGAAGARTKPARPEKESARRPTWVLAVAGLLAVSLAGTGIWYSYRLMASHRDFIEGQKLFATGDFIAGQERFERATSFRFEPRYLSRYAAELGHAGVGEGTAGAALIAKMEEVNGYLDAFPDAGALLDTARVYLHRSHDDPSALDQAARVLERVEPLDPENPEVDIRMSEVLLAQGRATEARQLLEGWTDRLEDDLAGFWGALTVARWMDGDREAAVAALTEAVALGPNDCRVLMARGTVRGSEGDPVPDDIRTRIGLNCGGPDLRYLEDLIERYED